MGVVNQSLRKARSLKPSRIRQDAERRFHLEIEASDEDEREALSRVFVPDDLGGRERDRAIEHIVTSGAGAEVKVRGLRVLGGAGVVVDWREPENGLRELLRAYPRYRLALGRAFPPLRALLARDLIQAVAARNAALAAISALPEVIPNPLSLVLALGEMGSDTVLLTANQIGLAFELAALRGEVVGWRAQAGPIGVILAGAFGWRALARELVSLIPAGYGLAAKSGIAYSGTLAVGEGLWRYRRRQPAARLRLPPAESRTPATLARRRTA
ncbi:MAG: hypothetical protein ACRD04_13050 [Terriglobales bacterium]